MVEGPDLGGRLATYRFSMKEQLRLVVLVGGAVAGIDAGQEWLMNEGIAKIVTHALGAAIAAMVVATPILAIVSLFFSVDVFEHGMRGQRKNGRSSVARWSDMSSVERRTVLGMRYARVLLHSGGEMWLPLWVVQEPRFRELVRACTGGADPFDGV